MYGMSSMVDTESVINAIPFYFPPTHYGSHASVLFIIPEC